MLINFCDPRLGTEVTCSTVSTEGYEVTNLINNSDKGFLAYSCIKPPINIDFTLIYNVQIHHILIWPSVGSQKSSGFQIFGKRTNDESVPYTILSTGYLNPMNSGVLFYPKRVNHLDIPTPVSFLKRYIKLSLEPITMQLHNLRICICKTENSVPALGKIEIWGTVSARCGKDVVASIHTLLLQKPSSLQDRVSDIENDNIFSRSVIKENVERKHLEVPECFLDAITWEIMTQPIILPSGKLIDQKTLEKHEQSEALWGRIVSDPFSGLPFTAERKPVIAVALKSRIDKFLLENCDSDEIKSLPRVLGHVSYKIEDTNVVIKHDTHVANINTAKHTGPVTVDLVRKKKTCHQLPVATINTGKILKNYRPVKKLKISNSPNTCELNNCNSTNDNVCNFNSNDRNHLDDKAQILLSNLKCFSQPKIEEQINIQSSCKCCAIKISYKLPCKHIVCRKMLLSNKGNQCNFCKESYKSHEISRVH
ncbi:RING finger protein 37-like [Prorops nasuta]|uniref:RING finger protein 37-like n=1 Tax=Prorops nasuta TaxID=863751 RepID=UPI0034CE3E95